MRGQEQYEPRRGVMLPEVIVPHAGLGGLVEETEDHHARLFQLIPSQCTQVERANRSSKVANGLSAYVSDEGWGSSWG